MARPLEAATADPEFLKLKYAVDSQYSGSIVFSEFATSKTSTHGQSSQ